MPAIQTDGGQILYYMVLLFAKGVFRAVKQRADAVTFISGPILFAMSCTSGFYLVL